MSSLPQSRQRGDASDGKDRAARGGGDLPHAERQVGTIDIHVAEE